MNKGFITGYMSDLKITIFEPNKNQIDILDIAHALSMLCRFNGHCKSFYSVAQHSVLVSRLCKKEYALEGLLHDGTEAYCGDLIRPIKYFLPEFKVVEDKFEKVIIDAFLLNESPECWKNVKNADNIALVTEARDLVDKPMDFYGNETPDTNIITPLSQKDAEELFLSEYWRLAWQRVKAKRLGFNHFMEVTTAPRLNM